MTKIDILTPTGRKGGVETMIQHLSSYLIENGIQLRVVQLIWEKEPYLSEDIPFYPLFEGRGNYQLDVLMNAYAEFLSSTEAPDLILATGWPYACYVAKEASKNLGAPKVVSYLHAPVSMYQRAGYGDEQALAYADAHLAISLEIENELHKWFDAVYRVNNVVLMPDESIVKYRPKRAPLAKRKLYYVGRFEPEKRLDLIIAAMQGNVSDYWELYIIGHGDNDTENANVQNWIKEFNVENDVHLLGWQDAPWECAADADAVVMASDYEGASMVSIEAMANGIGVISTPVGIIPEIIKPGINGYLFPCGDTKGLQEVLIAISNGILPDIDPIACRNTVQMFDKDTCLRNFKQILEKILLT